MSRVDRRQAAFGELEEQALRVFEPKLQALNLGLDQISQQSLPELEDSLERIADAMRHSEQFGTIRLKMNADAGVVIARTAAEAHFEVGILPILLQRKARVLDRIRLLRPEGSAGDLRQLIIQRVGDASLREDLLASVEKQREQHEQASQRDAESRVATEALAAENQSIFLVMAAAAARSGAARIARVAVGFSRLVVVIVVVFAAVAVAVPSLLGSPPWWIAALLAAVAAVPVALDILDKLAPGSSEGASKSPLRLVAHKVEAVAYRLLLRRMFADRGAEELALAAGTAGLLSAAEAASFSAESRTQRRRRAWVTAIVLMGLLAVVSAWVLWPRVSRDISTTVGQPVDLAGVFQLTVTARPTCSAATADAGATCMVIVELANISGEDQNIGAGSFGDIGPKGATFYYTLAPEDGQDYAIAAILKDQFFRISRTSKFDKNALHAGESTRAALYFDVRDGVTSLDEIQLAARNDVRRIHVRF